MADWCSLPEELLYSISQRLLTSTDILRFRSVCSVWRSLVDPPPPSASCYYVPLNSKSSTKAGGFFLTKRTIYTLKSTTPDASSSWIIKLGRDIENNRLLLFNPLNQSCYRTLPDTFDLLNFRIKELGQEYILHHIEFGPLANSIAMRGDIYKEKVAVLDNKSVDDDFVILTIEAYGSLVVYKSCEKEWRIIQGNGRYDDVILRLGRFYAVDNTGRLVLVNHVDLNVTTVANPIFGRDKKFLIDSDGELLLVSRYLRRFGTGKVCHRKLKAFRLDENVGNWTVVSDLRDKIVFLGDNCTFCASALDIFGNDSRDGSHILFMDRGLKIYDIESRSTDPIESRSYLKLFKPPTCPIYSAAPVEDGMNQLNLT